MLPAKAGLTIRGLQRCSALGTGQSLPEPKQTSVQVISTRSGTLQANDTSSERACNIADARGKEVGTCTTCRQTVDDEEDRQVVHLQPGRFRESLKYHFELKTPTTPKLQTATANVAVKTNSGVR